MRTAKPSVLPCRRPARYVIRAARSWMKARCLLVARWISCGLLVAFARCVARKAVVRSIMIRYLTGAHNDAVAAVAHEKSVGLLVQPGNRYDLQVHRYPTWAGDNGAFTKVAGGFSAEKFRAMLRRPALLAARARCLFVAAPDKLVVLPDGVVIGDARGTLEQFKAWALEIRELGYPVALVAQNGLETMLDEVPWDLVDVLFIGGSTEWKIGGHAQTCIAEARRRGKRTHMGRVNSYRRMKIAQDMGCDTADGTFLAFGPTKNLPRLLTWLNRLETDHASLFGRPDQRADGCGVQGLES